MALIINCTSNIILATLYIFSILILLFSASQNLPICTSECSKLSSLTEIIDKKSKKISDLFDEYETTSMNIRNYELVLMYYLGFMKGLEAKKIK